MKFESELGIVLDMLRKATALKSDRWITISRRDIMHLTQASGYGSLILLHYLRHHPEVTVRREYSGPLLFRYNGFRCAAARSPLRHSDCACLFRHLDTQ